MSTKMLINATHPEENRVAIVNDGILTELDIEIAGKELTKGNIYKATVVRVEPGLQAAFVDYGAERYGFLQMGDLHDALFKAFRENPENTGRPRITDLLHKGQELIVQVVKEERGTKGAALTTALSLPGRYMVLVPESDTKGISRKIESESERKKLKSAMAEIQLDPTMGYIVRTAGIGQTVEELHRDFNYLVRVYENILTLAKSSKSPALIYKESNLVIRSIRDYFSADMDEVLVDDPKVFQEAKDFFKEVMPECSRLVKLHQERRPIFARYQIEEQIDGISKNKVNLPSGGSIVIDSTEALVAIDVNSGKMSSEQGVESTAFKSNLEAAEEVGRQLRLRDLGGLIVIDFIDMRDRKHIREVEKCLKSALKNDKARVSVGRISQFGLLEMSRQRIKATLAEGSYLPCPHCEGTGQIKNAEAQALSVLRKIQAALAKGHIGRIEGEIPLEVASYLLNAKRHELMDLEQRHDASIFIKGRPDFVAGQADLEFLKREKEEPSKIEYVEGAALLPQPADTGEESETEEKSETKEGGEEEGKKRRRRRRRRRRKPSEGETTEETSAETEEASRPTTEEPKEGETPPPTEEPAPESPRQPSPEASAAAPEKAETAPEAPAQQATEGGEPETAKEAPKTARKRRSTKKAAPKEEPETSETEVKAEEETPPKPARRRRTTKKAEPKVEPEASKTEEKTEEEAPAKPARRRRTTKKAEPKEEPKTSETKEKAEEEAPTKPTRRRRTTKKAEPKEEPKTSETEEKPEEEAPAKPARRRRTTKKAEPKEEPEASKTEEKAEEEAPAKPARRRRTTKKAEPEAEPEASKSEEKAEEEAPAKPTRRRRTVKKAEPKEESETADSKEKAEEDSPKKPARRRRSPKKTEPKTEPENPEGPKNTEEETPAKPARRRRSPRKAEVKADVETSTETQEEPKA